MAPLLFLFFFFLLSCQVLLSSSYGFLTPTVLTNANRSVAPRIAAKSFNMELIHRDSPLSPVYDPSATLLDRAVADMHRSNARAHRINSVFQARTSVAATGGHTIVADLSAIAGEYTVNLQLGTPPVAIVAIADSGSDLSWTNCEPCEGCFRQLPPLFNPDVSSTFDWSICGSDTCDLLNKTCETDSICEYHVAYGDHSTVQGYLATDSATFSLSTGEKVIVPLAFGCNTNTSGRYFSNKTSGLIGLGAGPSSLVSQISSSFENKFAHCTVAPDSSATSKIMFGEEAVVSGDKVVSTPMTISSSTFYVLTLHEIIVPDAIPIDVVHGVEPFPNGIGNIVIDSGTTLTYLDAGVIDILVQTLKTTVNYPSVPDPTKVGYPLCFDISRASLGVFFLPAITFKFEGPAEVVLPPINWLRRVDTAGTVCLTMKAGGKLQILGSMAQQNFKVGYDLVENQVSFAPADCTVV